MIKKTTATTKPSVQFESIASTVKELPLKDLIKIQTLVEGLIEEKSSDNSLAAIVYEEIKKRLRLSVDSETRRPRYSFRQMESMKPWRGLALKKQKEFEKAWQHAVKFFTDSGFTNNSTLVNIMITVVAESPLMKSGELSLDNIIGTFSSIESVADETLPGWFDSSKTITLLQESFNNAR